MADELATRLRKLQDAHEADVVDDDAYQAGLAKLRAEYGAAQVDALLREGVPTPESRSHIQHIREYTSIQAAVAGDVHGDIYIVGERTQSTRALLAGYLRWLASQCGQLPLRGVREQKSATDVLNIGLDQVYTQLATTKLVEREMFEGQALREFDAQAYLEQHVGDRLLPGQQRERVETPEKMRRIPGGETMYVPIADGTTDFDATISFHGASLDTIQPDQLLRMARQSTNLTFYGSQLITEAIAASPHLVLLGEPGSGKSTALRYLALTLARAGLGDMVDLATHLEGWQTLGEAGKLIPLFMPLLPLAQHLTAQPGRNGTSADLWAAIDKHLIDHGATADIVTAMRTELARGHVLLLLDGLDEVAGGDSRRQVMQAVQAFAIEQPQCRLLVACRVRAYAGEQNAAWQLPGWPSVTLADWTPGQVHAFVNAWYAAAAAASHMPDARRDERIALLQRALAERTDLQRLSIRPLLLTIMALVHLNDGTLPEDRVSLYARCLDILLGQWESDGHDETIYGTLMQYIGLPDADVKSLRPLLARVAYAAQQAAGQGEVGRLRRADLRELVEDALQQLKHPNPHAGARRFLEYTDVRAGLLQASDAGDAYAFPHQTFQEYLAGLELISGVGFVERIMERRGDDRWRVPIFLGIGHTVSEGVLAAPYQLLNRLLHASKRDIAQRQRDFIFAAEIAEDVGWDRLERGGEEFSALRADLAQALADVVESTALPSAERVHAGTLLGRLGDPRDGVCTLLPAMVPIAGGSFVIGESRATKQYDNQINDQPLTLPAFQLARYPVTNAQFARFMADDGYNAAGGWWDVAGKAWLRQERRDEPSNWHNARFGSMHPNHPVVGITWYEAMAFCQWLTQTLDDGFVYVLPSEAEWEYAARGSERRRYPWNDQEEPDGERANFDQTHNSTTPVGCFITGATPEGLLDMAGNVWEWTRSNYTPYPYDPNDGRETLDDPAKKRFTLRGGSWDNRSIYLRASSRFFSPVFHNDDVGFRLARHLKV